MVPLMGVIPMCEKLCVHRKRVATLVFARPSQDVVLQGKRHAAAHATHVTHLISSCEGPPPRRLAAAAGASNIPASRVAGRGTVAYRPESRHSNAHAAFCQAASPIRRLAPSRRDRGVAGPTCVGRLASVTRTPGPSKNPPQ